jgi:beta-lactamase regulating signal transducer with metallopeptidase domain
MTTLVVESVLRSLVMAGMIWTGIKLLRVRHVFAQKIAWGLVLLVAFAMPLLMRWQAAHPGRALVVPVARTSTVRTIQRRIHALHVPSNTILSPRLLSLSPAAVAAPGISLQETSPAPVTPWHASDLLRLVIPTYLVVAAALLLRLLFGLALAMRIWHRAEPASPILEPRATVRISSAIQSPVTIGSGIVLPANYTEWDRTKLRFVLAHERSHVRQGDFYLQLLASVYAALVWFSPLGWYLKRRLAELGEAISDRAALQESADNSSYAEVLLEFAAMPRHGFAGVTAGVGMARSSNIQRRIERILNDRTFRLAFLSGRRHAVIAALLVPCGMVLATSLLHVQAAGTVKAHAIRALQANALQPPRALQTRPVPPPAPVAEPAPAPPVMLAEDAQDEQVQAAPTPSRDYDYDYDGSFAIVDGNRNSVIADDEHGVFEGSWDDHGELDRVRTKVHGSFLWFEHDGKSYVISDPALVARVKALYAPQGELAQREAELGRQQAELGRQQGLLAAQQAMVKVPTPDISKEMAELQRAVETLAAEKAQEVTQARLSEIQARLGALQGKLAEAQALAGSKEAILGSQEGNLGAREAELGRREAEFGREEARIAREASQQVKTLIDQAFKDGKAKPVD